jgi:hypothetical protein
LYKKRTEVLIRKMRSLQVIKGMCISKISTKRREWEKGKRRNT